MTADAFVANAKTLLDLGWHPIPLGGESGKALLESGVTGRPGEDVTDEDTFREWADRWAASPPGLNLGSRMPVGVACIDVDCYAEKGGAETLAAKVAEWGPLPATWSVTARSDGSRKMFFRVPDGWEGHGVAGPGIEVLQRHHRYTVAPHSVQDGVGLVRAYDPEGNDCGQLPPPGELPALPSAWVDGLRKDAPRLHSRGSAEEAEEIAGSFRDGPMDAEVTEALNLVLAAIEGGAGRHDSLNDALPKLARLGAAGRDGVAVAIRTAENEFASAVDDRLPEHEARREFQSSLGGAVQLVAGERAEMDFYTGRPSVFRTDGSLDPASGLGRSLTAAFGHDDDETAVGNSWTAVDVAAALASGPPPEPSVLRRDDGLCLFYAGKVHSVHGESESGKSWLVQCAAIQELTAEGSVLYVDFEDSVESVVGRLRALGVPLGVLTDAARFAYVRPEEALRADSAEEAFAELIGRPFTLAVVDGVTDAMGLFGYSAKDNDDIAAWQRELPRRIARASGAAVVCIDHVTKDADTRGRFAIGGQHKIAGLDGAAYTVEVERPFAVGLAGSAMVRVGKDRPGHVRKAGVGWRKSDRTQRIAEFRLDSTDPEASRFELVAPREDRQRTGSSLDTEGHAARVGAAESDSGFRPTWFMEKISRYLEAAVEPASRSQNKTIGAMCERRAASGKPQHRQHWRSGLQLLIEEGYVTQEPGQGARAAAIHTIVRPYRQNADPESDAYTGGRSASDFTVEKEASNDGSDV